MKVTKNKIEKMRIVDADRLDPIDVYFDHISESAAHITIICYGRAWTTFFSSMGYSCAKQFLNKCNVSYLLNRFDNGADKKRTKQTELYLLRIIEAVKEAIAQELQEAA